MMIAIEVCDGDKLRLWSHSQACGRCIRAGCILDQQRDSVIVGKAVCDNQVASAVFVEVARGDGSRISSHTEAARGQQSTRAVTKSDGHVIRNYIQLAVFVEIA